MKFWRFFLSSWIPNIDSFPETPCLWGIGCGATEATGLGFVCFVVINPCVLSANRVDLGFFLFHKFSNFTPLGPPTAQQSRSSRARSWGHECCTRARSNPHQPPFKLSQCLFPSHLLFFIPQVPLRFPLKFYGSWSTVTEPHIKLLNKTNKVKEPDEWVLIGLVPWFYEAFIVLSQSNVIVLVKHCCTSPSFDPHRFPLYFRKHVNVKNLTSGVYYFQKGIEQLTNAVGAPRMPIAATATGLKVLLTPYADSQLFAGLIITCYLFSPKSGTNAFVFGSDVAGSALQRIEWSPQRRDTRVSTPTPHSRSTVTTWPKDKYAGWCILF